MARPGGVIAVPVPTAAVARPGPAAADWALDVPASGQSGDDVKISA